jgi:hypothetical protein
MIIPCKHSGFRADGTRLACIDGGGGGGGGKQTSTSYTTNVPEYAKEPFMEMIGKGIALSEAPYQAYGGERTAQFTPLQQQAFGQAQNQQVAGQLGAATGLTGLASLQGLNAQFDPYATGQFTSQTAQQYMNPFMQNVVDIQKREAQRQSQIGQTQDQARAVQAGAFGGSRQAIVQAERDRNLAQQMGDIQATGSQAAFQAAQEQFNREQQMREQSRQFGAGFGMEGLRTALSGAGQLGQLGQQQFGQEMDIMGARQQMGTTQQQQIQRILDQQYGDFQAQRDYPYQQLGFLSDLLRGAGSSTRSIYSTPQPSNLQTIAGLGTAAAGFMAKGGEVRYADGGITGLLGDQELAQTAQNPAQGPMMQMAAQQQMAENAALRAAAPQGMPQPMVEDTMDPVEAALVVEMQKAMNEGDRQRAEALAETIEKRREERTAQDEMGIAAAASDEMGDIPGGGITGMAPVMAAEGGELRFSNGGSSGFMRDLRAFNERLHTPPNWEWTQRLTARQQRIAEEDARKRAEAEEQRRYRAAVTEARGKASFGNYLFGTPEREAEGIAELQRLREGGPEAMQVAAPAATPAANPQAITAASVDDRRRLTNPSYRPAVPKVADKPEDKAAPTPGPMDQGIAAAAAPRPDSSVQDAMARELAMQQGIAASLVQGSDEALAAQEKEAQERGLYGEEREKRLREQEAGLAGKKGEAKSMALVQAGLAILSADPSRGGLAAIGEGALKGLGAYKGDIKDLEEKRERMLEKLDEIADLRRQEKMADGKERRALVAQRNAAITEGQKLMYTTMSRFTDIERDEAKMVFDAAVRREIAAMPSGEERLLRQLGGGDVEKGIKKMADLKAKPFNYQDAYADFLKSFKPTLPGEQPMDYRTYVSMFALPTTSGGTTSQLPKGATVLPR